MRAAFLATSVPLPIAMPMSAALIAGASLTPSPVIATTSPFCFSVSASITLCSGATRPTTPIASIRSSRSLVERRELRAEDRLAVDAELLGDRAAGDDVVAGDHPYADVRFLGVCDGGLRFFAGRVDHRDQACHLEVLHVVEQVAVGVEHGRVQIAIAGGHHAQPVLAHPRDVLIRTLRQVVVPGDARRPFESAVVTRPITAGAAPLT